MVVTAVIDLYSYLNTSRWFVVSLKRNNLEEKPTTAFLTEISHSQQAHYMIIDYFLTFT